MKRGAPGPAARPAPYADSPLYRSFVVRPALWWAQGAGADAVALAARFGLGPSALEDRMSEMPLAAYRDLVDACAEAAREPFLGFRIATSLPRGYLGVFELSASSAPTAGEAAARFVKYLPLVNNGLLSARLDRGGGEVILRQWIDGEPLAQGRHGNEFILTAMLRQSREFTGRHVVPRLVRLAHPRPPDVGELERWFGAELCFDSGENALVVSEAVMALPQVAADGALLEVLDQHAARMLDERAQRPDDFLARVRRSVRENLTHSEALLPRVASLLSSSPRTLQRELTARGTSFRRVVDEVRAEAARAYAAEGELGVGEMAFLLGYADTPSFVRAFRRWTGQTVGDYRRDGAPAAPPR
ncbi:AraC family transcriptional regulator ligand-binding domain-containing protein [Sorangium sp. So ce394]|uniref:AraC family transcriptional regulator n=1 Tax=unclassified Sorangium TaxID=2621164 RepID=UPI003F5B4038